MRPYRPFCPANHPTKPHQRPADDPLPDLPSLPFTSPLPIHLLEGQKVTSSGHSSDQYWSQREAVRVNISYQYWSRRRPVLVRISPTLLVATAFRYSYIYDRRHLLHHPTTGRQIDLYWSAGGPILLRRRSYIGPPTDQYRFIPPPSPRRHPHRSCPPLHSPLKRLTLIAK